MSTTPDGFPALSVRSHPDCLLHQPPPGHPEAPGRLEAILKALEEPVRADFTVSRSSPLPPAGDIEGVLKWLHDPTYIERVRHAAESGSGWLDSHDCAVSRGTYRAALAAAGLTLKTALDLVNGRLDRAFLAVRPPGHHAERDRARGYCFFNSAAIAAEVVVRSWSQPVVVVDFDALHGNGTQSLFWERSDVGYLSVHRYPGFPGSGAGTELGAGPGLGKTRNIPMTEAADDDVFCQAIEQGLEELVEAMRPAVLVVSAGFTAAIGDPIGGMAISEEGFRRITRGIVAASRRWSGGRILSILEGGYGVAGLTSAVRAHVEELAAGGVLRTENGKPVN